MDKDILLFIYFLVLGLVQARQELFQWPAPSAQKHKHVKHMQVTNKDDNFWLPKQVTTQNPWNKSKHLPLSIYLSGTSKCYEEYDIGNNSNNIREI